VKFGVNSLPTVVVVSQTKKKFVNLVGIYDEKSIASFLDGVLSGKHGTSSFQDLPQACLLLL
jgi:thioredoxin-like negative regulator of GroEL